MMMVQHNSSGPRAFRLVMRVALSLIAVVTLLVPAGAGARPGQRDRAFSGDGRATLTLTGARELVGVAASASGAVSVLTDEFPEFVPVDHVLPADPGHHARIARLTAAGRPDGRFGGGGVLTVPALDHASGLMLDDRRRTVVWSDGLVRLTASGALDTTFGAGGSVRFAEGSLLTAVRGAGPIGIALRRGGGLTLARLRDDGALVGERSIPMPFGGDVRSSVTLIGPPASMTVVASDDDPGRRRALIVRAGGSLEVEGPFESVVDAGGDLFAVSSVAGAWPQPHYLERLTVSGGVLWRLPFRGRLDAVRRDIAVIADRRGGVFVAAPSSPSDLGSISPDVDPAVLVVHVTGAGRIDLAFGDRGVVALPAGLHVPKVAIALSAGGRLVVAYEDRETYLQRQAGDDAHVTVVALRTR